MQLFTGILPRLKKNWFNWRKKSSVRRRRKRKRRSESIREENLKWRQNSFLKKSTYLNLFLGDPCLGRSLDTTPSSVHTPIRQTEIVDLSKDWSDGKIVEKRWGWKKRRAAGKRKISSKFRFKQVRFQTGFKTAARQVEEYALRSLS